MTTSTKNDGIVEILESDYRRLTQSKADMLEALEAICEYIPDRNAALDYAATNDGRVGTIHLAAAKVFAAIAKAKGGAA